MRPDGPLLRGVKMHILRRLPRQNILAAPAAAPHFLTAAPPPLLRLPALRLLSTRGGKPPSRRPAPDHSRGALFSKLKSCRSREQLDGIEARLQPLRNTKEWDQLITAHAKVGNRARVLGMLDEMREAGCSPSVFSYNRLITACRKFRQWERALSLLDEMREVGVAPNVISFNAAISACEKGGQWKRALSLLGEMREAGVAPDVYSFSAAISACEKGGEWERALSLLGEMREAGVAPNVISFNAAISACEKGGEWERALSLLGEMREAGVAPNVISFNAAILACAAADQPSLALETFEEAMATIEPTAGTFNAVLDAVCTPQRAKARALWLQGVELGHYAKFETQERGVPKLDLHDLSEGAAETAVRWWLEERVPAMSTPPKRLIIVTGWGKSRSALATGDVRGRTSRVLADMGVATLPTDNPGRFVVDAEAWRAGCG